MSIESTHDLSALDKVLADYKAMTADEPSGWQSHSPLTDLRKTTTVDPKVFAATALTALPDIVNEHAYGDIFRAASGITICNDRDLHTIALPIADAITTAPFPCGRSMAACALSQMGWDHKSGLPSVMERLETAAEYADRDTTQTPFQDGAKCAVNLYTGAAIEKLETAAPALQARAADAKDLLAVKNLKMWGSLSARQGGVCIGSLANIIEVAQKSSLRVRALQAISAIGHRHTLCRNIAVTAVEMERQTRPEDSAWQAHVKAASVLLQEDPPSAACAAVRDAKDADERRRFLQAVSTLGAAHEECKGAAIQTVNALKTARPADLLWQAQVSGALVPLRSTAEERAIAARRANRTFDGVLHHPGEANEHRARPQAARRHGAGTGVAI